MNETLLIVNGTHVSVGETLMAMAGLVIAALVAVAIVIGRAAQTSALNAAAQTLHAEELEERMAELNRIQAETIGRLQQMGAILEGRQAGLERTVAERLDAVSHRVGQSIDTTARHTVDSLRQLHERLAVIDSAQKNLNELTSQVTTLRDVLANKQSRGAFGQARMEAIVQDGLPIGSFAFQYTLANRTRPDCAVFLPGDQRPLVIDAKFPLEAVTALRDATSDEERTRAAQRVRQDISRHVGDIAEKYLVPGETQDLALMFVPSESVYADLHDGFDDVVQKAYRARVILVSPSLLMLAIQVIQQIQKDARLREAADLIRTEVDHMVDDLSRLRERVVKLERHFGQATEDVRQILISSEKIEKRAARIKELEFEGDVGGEAGDGIVIPAPLPRRLEAGE